MVKKKKKKEETLTVCRCHGPIYNPKDSRRILLELIDEYDNVAGINYYTEAPCIALPEQWENRNRN